MIGIPKLIMFYRPNFCCHCGEKIIRPKWTPLTSRRFCDFCAIEQKQHDLLPRVAALVAILIGVAGLMAYFGGGDKPRSTLNAAAQSRETRNSSTQTSIVPSNTVRSNLSESTSSNSLPQISNAASVNTKQRDIRPNSSTETAYYCGAMTKKGTPCTRRVKTPGRCWQHTGQPVMTVSPN